MARNIISQIVLVRPLLPLLAIFVQAFTAAESIQNGSIGREEAWTYLKSFGYLTDTENYDDKALESALKIHQETYHLNVTGKLDPETINLITTPRCGVPDPILVNGSQSRGVWIGSFHVLFKLGVEKWPSTKYHLTYKINGGAQAKVGNYALLNALNYGFQLWAKVSKFTFQQVVPSSPADLLISFQNGDHGDRDLWEHGVLAYANPPTDGRLHLNAGIDWSFRPPSRNQFDLIWVVAHEIGHLLGIDHSQNTNAIMYAHVSPGKSRRALHSDDIAAIHAMYP
ncbi:putative envelysin [Rosa chinensis]|uniref:Putative envelysin n=1 Tax=Rosa chinensis TaxID=74649 RepID=A0A2P6PNP9_ROSCH|nr:metalloendoproteinase 1 [Rosa chinensis]PRQ23536.1 putative envelysin [Rosa chinensis]